MEVTGREGGDAECIDQIGEILNLTTSLKIIFILSQNQTVAVRIFPFQGVCSVLASCGTQFGHIFYTRLWHN